MSEPVESYLTTRKSLQRMAKRLGIEQEQESHILAGEIENRLERLILLFRQTTIVSNRSLNIRCSLCGDDGGPHLVRDGRLICEECDAILGRAVPAVEAELARRRGS